MRKMRKFSQGGRAEAARDRRMADIEKDYRIALAKGKSEREAAAKRDQRIADAKDDYAKRTGADRTETRAAEKAAEARLAAARRGVDKDIKPLNVTREGSKPLATVKDDIPKVETPKVGGGSSGGYDSMSFGAAFRQAMKDKGRGGTFTWKGKSYKLETAGSTPAKKPPRTSTPSGSVGRSGASPTGRGPIGAMTDNMLLMGRQVRGPSAATRRAVQQERAQEWARGMGLKPAKFAKGGKVDGIAVRGKTKLKRTK